MNLQNHARAGARRRARLTIVGVAAGATGLALLLAPAARAQAAPVTRVGCSATALAAAVSGAASGAQLSLAPWCNYVVSSGLEAAVSLSIEGNDDTITAGTSGLQILTVDAGTTVMLDDLNFANGAPAISNAGTLAVTYSIFTGNTLAISNTGTGATSRVDGTLTVSEDTIFSRNTEAISNLNGTVTVTDSSFTRNTGAISGNARVTGLGGAYESIISVSDSTFSNNTSSGDGGAINTGNGQGTFKDDRFSDNTAVGSGGAVAGGPCNNEGNDVVCGTVTITGSTFYGNTAATGGAIANARGLTVTGSTFSGNSATDPTNGYGGALYGGATLTNTAISHNTAAVDGGGIYALGGATLTDTQVYSNTPDNCAPAGTIAGCTG